MLTLQSGACVYHYGSHFHISFQIISCQALQSGAFAYHYGSHFHVSCQGFHAEHCSLVPVYTITVMIFELVT